MNAARSASASTRSRRCSGAARPAWSIAASTPASSARWRSRSIAQARARRPTSWSTCCALPPRGAGDRAPHAPAHRRDLRLHRGRRDRLHRDGAGERQAARRAAAGGARATASARPGRSCASCSTGSTTAHGQGVLHRDLKPGNMLIDDDGPHQDHRLRRRAHRYLDHHAVRRHRRHAALHGARAVQRRRVHAAHRPLPGRRHRLRAGDRRAPVHRHQRARSCGGCRTTAPANPSEHNPRSPGARLGDPEGAVEGPGRALRLGARVGRRAAQGPRGEPRRPARDRRGRGRAAAPAAPAASLLDKARLLAGARRGRRDRRGRRGAGGARDVRRRAATPARRACCSWTTRNASSTRCARCSASHYHVFTAENGTLALEFVQALRHPRRGERPAHARHDRASSCCARCARRRPSAVRILLTGYSDLAAIVGSINDGEVFRFVKKPWDNAELRDDARRRRGDRRSSWKAPGVRAARRRRRVRGLGARGRSRRTSWPAGCASSSAGEAAVHARGLAAGRGEGPRSERSRVIVADLAAGTDGPGHALQAAEGRASRGAHDPGLRRARLRARHRAHQPGAGLPLPGQARRTRASCACTSRPRCAATRLYRKNPALARQHKVERERRALALGRPRLFDRIRGASAAAR